MGGRHFRRTGRTGLGRRGSPAQGLFGASCKAYGGPSSSENRAHLPGGDGPSSPRGCSEPPARPMGGHRLQRTGRTFPGGDAESSPGAVRSLLQGQPGAIIFREPGAPASGGRGVQPRGCAEPAARPIGGHLLLRTRRTGLGGMESRDQSVLRGSCKANGGPSSSENPGHLPWGDGEPSPGGVRSLLQGQFGAIIFGEPGAPAWVGRGVQPRGCSEPPARPMEGYLLQRTGRTGRGGTRSPAQEVLGASCSAYGRPPSSENRAHRTGGNGESCPGGVRRLLQGQWGAIIFGESGSPAWGDGVYCAGGVLSLLQRIWGAIFVGEPGAAAWGGRRVLPRGCLEPPARATGGHLLQRTERTGPGWDGDSCPGGVRSLLPGQWGAIFFREPGAPAWGGRGVLPRGCSEPPARPMGGQLLQGTGRTALGGTGSQAQGVVGASCKAGGGPSTPENRAHKPGGDGESCPGRVQSLR